MSILDEICFCVGKAKQELKAAANSACSSIKRNLNNYRENEYTCGISNAEAANLYSEIENTRIAVDALEARIDKISNNEK